jgi:two-component system, sensor histidine kinase and response regulator
MSKIKILVVEDEINIRETLRDILYFYGYEVELAEDGLVATQVLKVWQPDLILCDIMMPGINGFEFLEYVRSINHFNSVPFIFLTAKKIEDDFRTAMELGSDDYIVKPFKSHELIKTIENKIKRFKSLNIKNDNLDLGWNEIVQSILTTPLYALVASIDLVNQDDLFKNEDEKNSFIQQLKQSSFKTLKNLENLFYYKKIISNEPISGDFKCNIQNTLYESVQKFQNIYNLNDTNFEINLNTTDGLDEVIMSRKEALLIVNEILENSIKHNSPGIKISISGKISKNFYKLTIVDNGKGFAVPNFFTNPFNQNTTITDDNLKLGLFIINSILEVNKGKLDIKSEYTIGTTVELYFPM